MTSSLKGKTALVTGATRGIGRATARLLLECGATVIATGTKEDGDAPNGCEYRAIDFTNASETLAFAENIAKSKINILINNAGINKINPFAEIDPKDFLRIQQVNVTAPFLLCRAVIPAMREKQWGRIVNVSSIWGKKAKEYRGSYSTSKFGLDGMTQALAAEVAADGILANCVAPGIIDTELTRTILGDIGVEELAAKIPVGRLGRPEEIAYFICWLAGPENTYITGQNLSIDGGLSRV